MCDTIWSPLRKVPWHLWQVQDTACTTSCTTMACKKCSKKARKQAKSHRDEARVQEARGALTGTKKFPFIFKATCYETSTFHFFSWLLAGNSYMVTLQWCLTYTLIYLLVTRPPLTILTWPLESWWLFTNTGSLDSCAARYCDSELRLTVHCCALWPIVAVTLLFLWHLLFALLYCSLTVYKSGMLGTL